MKKTIVLYYSNNGSNRFLAGQIIQRLQCDSEEIKPVLNVHLLMLMGVGFGNQRLKHDLSAYNRVILVGPVWMGKFIYPLKHFVKDHKDKFRELVFVTCCGSPYEKKEEKFGHGLVFKQLKEMLPGKKVRCTAFPITLTLSKEETEDPKKVLETRLNENNFKGELLERFDGFMQSIMEKGTIPEEISIR
jgi:menaquinone-dependent protoporphyrinogen IX oxidase